MLRKGLVLLLGMLLVVASASYAVDLDQVYKNVFDEDDTSTVLNQIALDTMVEIFVDEGIEERDITEDWTTQEKTLRYILYYVCGTENVWGVVDDVVMVAPIDEENATFRKLSGEVVAISLLYADSAENALNQLADYYQRFCKPDEERSRILVHAPPRIRETIEKDLDVIDSPRDTVVISSVTAVVRESWLNAFGFSRAEYEWGTAVEERDYQSAKFITGIGGIYLTEKASRLLAAIDLIAQKGHAEIKANPSIVGQVGYPIEVNFTKKIWKPVTLPREDDDSATHYISYELQEIEAPIVLKATPLVKGNDITLKDMVITVANIGGYTEQGGVFPVVNVQTAKSRITVKDGETIIVGGLNRTVKRELANLILPGKRWQKENEEVLIFVTPRIWTPELAKKETFLEKVLEIEPEQSLTKKRKGFIKRHPFISLLIVGGIAWGACSIK